MKPEIILVKRTSQDFIDCVKYENIKLLADPNSENPDIRTHYERFNNTIKILKDVGINYWSCRKEIENIANLTFKNANFAKIINSLEEYEEQFLNLQNKWVLFTDNDDWVDSNIVSVLQQEINSYSYHRFTNGCTYNDSDLDVIIWNHVRYNTLQPNGGHNRLDGNAAMIPTYVPNPKLQSNHCLIKINKKFVSWVEKNLQEWQNDFKSKAIWGLHYSQHWNLDKYVHDNNVIKKYVPYFLSMWNNTPISFSQWNNPEVFSREHKPKLIQAIRSFTNTLPKNIDYIIKNNIDTNFLNYIVLQQKTFQKIIQNNINTAKNQKTYFCICSKDPDEKLLNCILSINLYYDNAVIHIIDSNSSDKQFYTKIKKEFPEIKIHFCENQNYELGAWKYAVNNIEADNLILIQDSMSFKQYFEFDFEANDCYIFNALVGFSCCDGEDYDKGLIYLVNKSKYKDICLKNRNNEKFEIATHTSFGIKTRILKNIINDESFIKLPTCKIHSQLTERIMGLVFEQHQIKVGHISNDHYKKIHGSRA